MEIKVSYQVAEEINKLLAEEETQTELANLKQKIKIQEQEIETLKNTVNQLTRNIKNLEDSQIERKWLREFIRNLKEKN